MDVRKVTRQDGQVVEVHGMLPSDQLIVSEEPNVTILKILRDNRLFVEIHRWTSTDPQGLPWGTDYYFSGFLDESNRSFHHTYAQIYRNPNRHVKIPLEFPRLFIGDRKVAQSYFTYNPQEKS